MTTPSSEPRHPGAPNKRCICGRSATFPICDGQHVAQGWQCDAGPDIDTLVIATGHLRSVGERLAHALNAAVGHRLPRMPGRVRRLLVLVDGHDLDAILAQVGPIHATRRTAVIVDAPASVGLAFAG